ncbi:FAD-binding oxidoreductase [uncultured Jannaschia sp.]|uniref:NAD(P)/FAD-dependent oxidoreductase n=1 Tax=uncultured Jannaschia sp. TaxID=293347 RepID=UPI0026305ADA|nr:FAD-dependent oxidoreductase [uncultured Jannaschia sp.]
MAIDATILGAGIFGLSCAWAMARRGARVRVIDPNGVASGASGGIVGALAPHVPEQWNAKKAFQLDSLLMSEAWWAEVAAAGGGDPGYARTGRLQPISDAAAEALATDRAEGARHLWRGAATWQVEPAPEAWSPGTPRVIRDTLSARIHPARACDALERALDAQGAEIVSTGPTRGAVLHATGWHGLGTLSDAQGRTAGVGVKGQAVLLDLDRRDRPQLFVDGLHIVPHADGTTAVGSTTERDFDDTGTDARLDALLVGARAAVPDLAHARVLQRWAGIRPRARSRAPLLGVWPGRPEHFIANGGFKIGFGISPKVAEVMADLILEGHDRIPEAFSTAGLAPWSGAD